MKRIFFLIAWAATQVLNAALFTPEEIQKLKENFFANIQPHGAIIASPSRENPNYYYDWVRDAAITMNLIERWYEVDHAPEYRERLDRYVSWTHLVQHQHETLPGQDILGEPKFYVDGSPFAGPWGRPQNDGPALRASVLIHFAQELLKQNEAEYVHYHLYQNTMDPATMGAIKMDLEYTAHHWTEENFDLWEEVSGHHFFTEMVQQKALYEGAALARRLHDEQAATFYEKQADLINIRLYQHLDTTHQLIQATIPPHLGPQKTLELDSSVILGLLWNPQNGLLALNSIYVEKTVNALHEQFNQLYPINNNAPGPILFGRYPGDTYDGYQNHGAGNPWFILTATVAEYYYALADTLAADKSQKALVENYIRLGDGYLRLIKQYAPDMNISEQINLNTGVQQGAQSLTWSYVSLLHALDLREKLEKKLV